MRNIFFLIFLLCCWQIGYSQFPITQNFGGPSTLTLIPPNGGFKASLINRTFTDTTAANLTPIDAYAGSQIFTTSDGALWVRNTTATKWLQILSTGSSSDTLTWKLGGNDFTGLSGYAVLGSTTNDPIYFMTNNLKRLGIPETGILRSASAFNKCLTFDTATKLMYYGDCSGGGGGGGFGRIGLIDSLGHFSNGASTDGNSLFMQTATESSPGLLSAEDKAKIDSLNNIYWYAITKTGYLSTAYRPNDSTIYAKALLLSTPSEITNTLSTTDTTGTWALSWTSQSAYQAFRRASGVGVPSFGYIDSNYFNGGWAAQVRNVITAVDTIYRASGKDSIQFTIGGRYYAIKDSIGSGGGTPAGNYGNLQINRNGAFAAPASDTLIYTTSGGFVVKNIITGNALYLPNSTTSLGAIYIGGTKWMHNYSPGSSPNQAWGLNAGSLSTASTNTSNISIGDGAGANFNSTGNIAIGYRALSLHTGADPAQDLYNTAIGYNSMGLSVGGRNNTAVGVNTLKNAMNTSYSNAAVGKGTMLACDSCGANSWIGASFASGAAFKGTWNAGAGADNFVNATTATGNSVLGSIAAQDGTTAQENTLAGYYAFWHLTTGSNNVALGAKTALNNTTGSGNIAIGYGALSEAGNGNGRLAIGYNPSLTTVNYNIIGNSTGQVGINKPASSIASLAYELTVGGRMAIETIDSTGTGTAINMLYQDPATGLIKKAAVPSGGGSGDILNGGNTTGATVTVGTNDANAFNLETTNVTRVAIGATGGTTIGNTSGGTGVVPLTVDAPSGLTTDMARFTKNGFSTGYFVIDKDGNIAAIGSNAAQIKSAGTLVSFPTGITFNSLTSALGYGILSTDGSAGTFGSTPFVFDMSANTTDSRNNLLLRNSNATNPGYNLKAITSGNIQQFIIDGTGNVGIGNLTPSAQLHTNGTVRFAGLSNSAAQYVVHADVNGNLSYADTTAGGGGMTYPGAGIANSTGSAWGTSYTTTGSGTVLALATSPTFVTPVLGTPTSVTLTNATGLPEGGLSLTDITTANTSTSAHGFFPKLTSNSVYYVNNSGALTALTVGASGTVLTGNGVTSAPTWAAPSTVATAMPFNGLTAATGTNSIDNTSYAQSWDWSTISNGTALNIKSNGIGSSGTLFKLSTTVAGTMTGTTSSLLNIDATGATGSTPTPTGIIININATSGSALNTGMKVSAYGGGGPNYAAKFLRGVVGLGTAGTETGVLEFNGSTSGTVGLQSAVAAGTWTMTLPTTGGTSGYFLQTNGSGVTTWAAPTGSTTSTLAYVAKTANYTITTSDYLVNCTSGTFTITLPTAASITGQSFQVKNSGTGVITINTTSSQTVDGYASGTLTISQYQSLTFMSDGSNWILL